jgi:hypothetical protein
MIGRRPMISSMSTKPDAARLRSSQGGLRAIHKHPAFMLGNAARIAAYYPNAFNRLGTNNSAP